LLRASTADAAAPHRHSKSGQPGDQRGLQGGHATGHRGRRDRSQVPPSRRPHTGPATHAATAETPRPSPPPPSPTDRPQSPLTQPIPLLSRRQLLMPRECQESAETGVKHQPKQCQASADHDPSSMSRSNTGHRSRRGDSNPEPLHYKCRALPVAPRRRMSSVADDRPRMAGKPEASHSVQIEGLAKIGRYQARLSRPSLQKDPSRRSSTLGPADLRARGALHRHQDIDRPR